MNSILLLTIVALGSATALYDVQKEIRVENDRIVVRIPGKVVVIDKTKDDDRSVLIFIKEQGHIRKIIIDQNQRVVKDFSFSLRDKLPEVFSEEGEHKEITKTSPFEELNRQTTHSECRNISGAQFQIKCLVAIFKNYQGIVGDGTFRELLEDIKMAVDINKCHPLILEVLQELEVETPSHTSFHHFWPLHRNIEELRNKEDHQTLTQMYGTQPEHQLNRDEGVHQNERHHHERHHEHINHQEHLDDTLRTMASVTSTRHTNCSQGAMEKQLAFQSNIRELQGQIYNYQLKVQQLQLQQQFLNQQKHHTKLQIVAEQQRNTPSTQLQEFDRVREELHQKEHQVLETQRDLYHTIHQLQQELTRQIEKLQQCLEDERRQDERSMRNITQN